MLAVPEGDAVMPLPPYRGKDALRRLTVAIG